MTIARDQAHFRKSQILNEKTNHPSKSILPYIHLVNPTMAVSTFVDFLWTVVSLLYYKNSLAAQSSSSIP